MDPVRNILNKSSRSDRMAFSIYKKPFNKLTKKQKDNVFEAMNVWQMGID